MTNNLHFAFPLCSQIHHFPSAYQSFIALDPLGPRDLSESEATDFLTSLTSTVCLGQLNKRDEKPFEVQTGRELKRQKMEIEQTPKTSRVDALLSLTYARTLGQPTVSFEKTVQKKVNTTPEEPSDASGEELRSWLVNVLSEGDFKKLADSKKALEKFQILKQLKARTEETTRLQESDQGLVSNAVRILCKLPDVSHLTVWRQCRRIAKLFRRSPSTVTDWHTRAYSSIGFKV